MRSPVRRRFVRGDWWRLPESPRTNLGIRLRRLLPFAGDEGLCCRNMEAKQIESEQAIAHYILSGTSIPRSPRPFRMILPTRSQRTSRLSRIPSGAFRKGTFW